MLLFAVEIQAYVGGTKLLISGLRGNICNSLIIRLCALVVILLWHSVACEMCLVIFLKSQHCSRYPVVDLIITMLLSDKYSRT